MLLVQERSNNHRRIWLNKIGEEDLKPGMSHGFQVNHLSFSVTNKYQPLGTISANDR